VGLGLLVCHGPSVNGHGPLVCAGGGGAYMGLGLHVANMGVAVPKEIFYLYVQCSEARAWLAKVILVCAIHMKS
jgi:hypothetical protein